MVKQFGNSFHIKIRSFSGHWRLGGTFSDLAQSLLQGKSYFKFENMWLKFDGFMERVKQWWQGYFFQGSSSHVVCQKLKALKQDLKLWNKEVFGHVGISKQGLL